MSDEAENNRRADEKSAKRKEARDKMMAGKTIEKGLLIVHTGKGKGKSTAAFGMVMRCIGHGMKVGVIQFIKGKWDTGERWVLEKFPELCTIKALGEGFTWETQDRARDIAHARAAWEEGKKMMVDPAIKLVLLDELNIALRYDYLPIDEIVETLNARRPDLHVIVTGRNAKDELIAISGADPLNLAGILTSGLRIPAITAHRILLRDGVPVAALKAGQTIALGREAWESDGALERALRVGRMPPELRPYYS